MKYGVDIAPFGPFGSAQVVADLAREAEQAGWDGFFIWDHVAREWTLDVVDPWIALTAAAMQTRRIRIGTLVTPLPRRRPWKLARETVSIDRLSGGRLILGVGLGSGRDSEWANLGEETDPKARGQMLDEALDVLAGLWSGEPFSYEGTHYRVRAAHFLPPPVQQPRIPIWVGGTWPNKAPFRRAARWDGAFPIPGGGPRPGNNLTPEDIRAVGDLIRGYRSSGAPFDLVCRGVTPGGDPARAAETVAAYREAGATWWIEAVHPTSFGGSWEGEWPVEAMRARIRQGPPRE